jgi:hypothetical protein
MKWLRRIAAGLRALLRIERTIERLRWRRPEHDSTDSWLEDSFE